MGEALIMHRTIVNHPFTQVVPRVIDLMVDEEVCVSALQISDDRIKMLLVGALGKTMELASKRGEFRL
jgi:hypothetical protein